jgi:hypothetical protein
VPAAPAAGEERELLAGLAEVDQRVRKIEEVLR